MPEEGNDRAALQVQLAERERLLVEREQQVARAEARVQAAIAAQKEQLSARALKAETERGACGAPAAERARAAELLRERELELDRRERELVEREELVDRRNELIVLRELETARQAIGIASRETETARRATELAQHRAVDSQEELRPRSHWTLERLSRLVHQRGGEYPDRIAEWEAYLHFLGDYASAAEPLPATFDALVADVFEPLLDGDSP